MRFMNEFDIERAVRNSHPIKARAGRIMQDLMHLANDCSDGWCYWKVPATSAGKLMALIEDMPNPTEDDLVKACRPIKAMLTRYRAQLNGRRIEFGQPTPQVQPSQEGFA